MKYKFRAYDDKNKVMVYSDKVYTAEYDGISSNYHFEFNTDGEVCCYAEDEYLDQGGNRVVKYRKLENLMQYIGAKDSDGREIYECDVVRCYGYCFETSEDYDYVIKIYDTSYYQIIKSLTESGNIELYGNFYVNPELLK